MQATYIKALEQRAKWNQFADKYIEHLKQGDARREQWGRTCSHPTHYARTLRMYRESLGRGDTLYMDKNFCALVDHARQSVPDDLFFEDSWMQTPAGFMWLDTPFDCPVPPDMPSLLELTGRDAPMIHAVSWYPCMTGGTTFMTYQGFDRVPQLGTPGFGCWTYFTMAQNDRLIDRLQQFEETVVDLDSPGFGQYTPGKLTNMKHEVRWVYTAMHLMAQRLAVTSQHRTSPLARSMAARKKLQIGEFLKVVTLRRKQPETHESTGQGKSVEWSCRWLVEHHWRNQWYPSENIHRQIYIDPYLKGPEDKPFKQPGHTLYKAQR